MDCDESSLGMVISTQHVLRQVWKNNVSICLCTCAYLCTCSYGQMETDLDIPVAGMRMGGVPQYTH